MSLYLELYNETERVHLNAFKFVEVSKTENITRQRGAFARASHSIGDKLTQPMDAVISGSVHTNRGKCENTSITSRDDYKAWIERSEIQWLIKPPRRYLIGGLLSQTETDVHAIVNNAKTVQSTFALVIPLEFEGHLLTVTSSLIAGVNNIVVPHEGNAITFPVIKITGANISDVKITNDKGQVFAWQGNALGTNELIIDCFFGAVLSGTLNIISEVLDNSQFIGIAPNGDNFIVEVDNTGSLSLLYRTAYLL